MALTQVDGGLLSPTNGQFYSMKNRIINGAMVIDQRNAGASVNTSASYPVDRTRLSFSGGGVITAQQSATAPTGFTKSIYALASTADASVAAADFYGMQQFIEGFNAADLGFGTASASAVTISFWVQSSITGTYCAAITNTANNRSYVAQYSISVANTWEYKSVTIPGDTSGTWNTDSNAWGRVRFSLGGGTDSQTTAGAWAAGNFYTTSSQANWIGTLNATFYITGVQLEKGSTATSFDYRPYGTELALCQRYYYQVASGANGQIAAGYYYSASQIQAWVKFAVSMRAAPVISTVTGTNYYKIEPSTGGTDTFNSFTINLPTTEGTLIYNNSEVAGTGGSPGQIYTNNAAAFVAFSSEL
jgi:hypothetical protein